MIVVNFKENKKTYATLGKKPRQLYNNMLTNKCRAVDTKLQCLS